ncbi:Hypothetical predicted protein [Podarcis lilfordi]|uniref:Uncharacterized protein n=1 Tax=Podarcis lilfordi TaxID=74358 RepID=A0AA35PIJ5_9SAUR|nr:Hypothetical predicted protein [Podarcis lilfordi]
MVPGSHRSPSPPPPLATFGSKQFGRPQRSSLCKTGRDLVTLPSHSNRQLSSVWVTVTTRHSPALTGEWQEGSFFLAACAVRSCMIPSRWRERSSRPCSNWDAGAETVTSRVSSSSCHIDCTGRFSPTELGGRWAPDGIRFLTWSPGCVVIGGKDYLAQGLVAKGDGGGGLLFSPPVASEGDLVRDSPSRLSPGRITWRLPQTPSGTWANRTHLPPPRLWLPTVMPALLAHRPDPAPSFDVPPARGRQTEPATEANVEVPAPPLPAPSGLRDASRPPPASGAQRQQLQPWAPGPREAPGLSLNLGLNFKIKVRGKGRAGAGRQSLLGRGPGGLRHPLTLWPRLTEKALAAPVGEDSKELEFKIDIDLTAGLGKEGGLAPNSSSGGAARRYPLLPGLRVGISEIASKLGGPGLFGSTLPPEPPKWNVTGSAAEQPGGSYPTPEQGESVREAGEGRWEGGRVGPKMLT